MSGEGSLGEVLRHDPNLDLTLLVDSDPESIVSTFGLASSLTYVSWLRPYLDEKGVIKRVHPLVHKGLGLVEGEFTPRA